MWVVMSVSGVKTIDDNLVVILPFGMYVLFIVQGHGNMVYFLAAEEDQVSLPHCSAIDTTGQKIMLLISITWNDVASHAVAQLHQAAAIYPFPACSSPEIGASEKGAGVSCDRPGLRAWIDFLAFPYHNIVTREPASTLTRQYNLHTSWHSCVHYGQSSREVARSKRVVFLRLRNE